MQKVLVECKIYVEVELPDDVNPEFEIQDNSCPGTRFVGEALDKFMEKAGKSKVCLFCANQCENKIVRILDKDKPA